jgi:hypothetical protein
MILGSLEAALLGTIVTVFVVSLAPQTRTPILTSPTGRVVCRVLDTIEPVLPGEIRAELSQFWNPTATDPIANQDRNPPEPAPAALDSTPAQANATDSGSAMLQSLLKDGEARVGRAITEAADKELQGTPRGNDRSVERR